MARLDGLNDGERAVFFEAVRAPEAG